MDAPAPRRRQRSAVILLWGVFAYVTLADAYVATHADTLRILGRDLNVVLPVVAGWLMGLGATAAILLDLGLAVGALVVHRSLAASRARTLLCAGLAIAATVVASVALLAIWGTLHRLLASEQLGASA